MEASPRERLRAALLDHATLVRSVASGRRRGAVPEYRRVELRYVDLAAGLRLQITAYDDTQAHATNLEPGPEAEQAVDRLLDAGFGSWHVERVDETLQVRVTKKGRVLVHAAARPPDEWVSPDRAHDRAKQRRLDATDPLFTVLGIATRDGVVKPSRTAKFRQVQDLLAQLAPVVDDAMALGRAVDRSPGRPLRVVDLGCGNALLTFAAFRYLTTVRGLAVDVVGVDRKQQALEHNTATAVELGLGDHVSFVKGDIATVEIEGRPDLVLALHACDTATDDALARAVQWTAPVVLAAPCCHHDIARQLSQGRPPAPYRLVTRHGILRERLADVLTDALRAALLRLVGYRVDVVEFVDSRHTPRNALIRAVRTEAPAGDEVWSAYRALTAEWQVTPALESRLRAAVPELDARLG